MVRLYNGPVYLKNGKPEPLNGAPFRREGTLANAVLCSHNSSADPDRLRIRFDSLTSHDITYVGIIQTARASGMTVFPMPYVLTNCHNSLCAVGGTINEDDHRFALSAAHKYGGIYVPANIAVIHSYNREMMAGCGKMILGSDSHTRYGALGTLSVGEGGGELAKQLLGRTWDIDYPAVICVYLSGTPRPGVGPQDIALSLIKAVYANGFVKNAVMEFIGPGIASLDMDYRFDIDVMTTETTCLSSIWQTDDTVRLYLEDHGRPGDYRPLSPREGACYDRWISVELDKVEPMIALPAHPSNVFTIRELQQNAGDILSQCQREMNEKIKGASIDLMSKIHGNDIHVEQAVIAGCSGGTFGNLCAAADILRGADTGNGAFRLSVYPDSFPTYLELMRQGILTDLASAGAVIRECFCGPCFGAGDTPANGELSIRHTTRNFPNREGSKPGEGQLSGVCLMDARSIAATASRGGILTSAAQLDTEYKRYPYHFDGSVYAKRVYDGYGRAEPDHPLVLGPNIRDWPEQPSLGRNLLVKMCSCIQDPVTTTDELIPSGETSSFRSNPERLSEFALSRRDPDYVPRAKAVRNGTCDAEARAVLDLIASQTGLDVSSVNIASAIFARRPGDGSAREQAASCQRVLGGAANFALEYATKRYRSNCINWGILPFVVTDEASLNVGDWVFIPELGSVLENSESSHTAYAVNGPILRTFTVTLGELTGYEKQILRDGCLINYYRHEKEGRS